METRPRLTIQLSPLDRSIESLSFILLLVLWCFSIYAYVKLPAVIPSHYNISGHVDAYGSKTTLIILLVFVTIIYIGLTQLNKYPHIFNYVKQVTVDNAKQQYTFATRMLRFLKLALVIIFLMIILFTYLTTIGEIKGLGIWFLPVCIILVFVPISYTIIKSVTAK